VRTAVERQLVNHPRRTLTEKAIAHYGLIVVVESLAAAAELSNEFAPEHLELEVADPWRYLAFAMPVPYFWVLYTGSSGDYLAGPNHIAYFLVLLVMPPLWVETSETLQSLFSTRRPHLQKVAGAIDVLAKAEGLLSHAGISAEVDAKCGTG